MEAPGWSMGEGEVDRVVQGKVERIGEVATWSEGMCSER